MKKYIRIVALAVLLTQSAHAGIFGPPATASASSTGIVSNTDYRIFDNDPSYVFQKVFDFFGYYQCSDTITPDGVYGAQGGTGATCTVAGGVTPLDGGHPGLLKLNMGTTSTGNTFVAVPIGTIFGSGTTDIEWLVNIPTLSNGTDRYTLIFGTGNDQTTVTAPNSGVYFKYSDNLNSGNWTEGTSAANARTEQDSGIAVATGWTKLKASVNAAASSVQYYINGSAAGAPITTNITTATNTKVGPYASATKALGTASTSVYADYAKIRIVFTTPR